jgi:hypothetical protein
VSFVGGVALALSEAVGNTTQHAYPDAAGSMEVSMLQDDHEIIVTVADTGVGIDHATDSPGLGVGLELIGRLTHYVDGPLWRRRNHHHDALRISRPLSWHAAFRLGGVRSRPESSLIRESLVTATTRPTRSTAICGCAPPSMATITPFAAARGTPSF